MSTNRELLEAAAKAAGIAGYWDDAYGAFITQRNASGIAQEAWCPLTDDGCALRLAVKLRAVVGRHVISIYLPDSDKWLTTEVDQSVEACSAIRRAIVRAAASMADQEKAE